MKSNKKHFLKDPDAVLDYAFDWTDWLAPGETISSYTLTVSPVGITLFDDAESSGVITFWLDHDGTLNTTYTITCHIVSSAGREDDEIIVVTVTNVPAAEDWYCTLLEFKDYLLRRRSYVAKTISFAQTGSIIADTYKRLGRFVGATLIQVAGSAAGNNGVWEVVSVTSSAIVVSGTLTTAAIGASVTLTDVSNPEDDGQADQAIESACRAIEDHCHRRFWTTALDEDRVFTPEYPDCFFSPVDIVSIATLAIDENGDGTYERTWAAGDYSLQPGNNALDGKPYTRVQITPNGHYSFPRKVLNGLKITGKFGWPAVPAKVKSATLMQAARFYERRNSPFGVIAVTDVAVVTTKNDLDPDVQILLQGLVRQII